ncbi:hypothetical protein SPRG_20519 [Saprolegnia parasitica CBS 223.65]|uniref:Uncharacterized protein n=1 Tax=Saprolegnia parasitica (strain CBS 223.65) TaxID=695850 RepID=A0A067CJM2_SAPPC|nr:hypothetical protein SPRG_20519 [Saprolegnia parasitica CBS 223.65]KDO26721.1 hypothetical protein SPRG_20519 [Saprolegnia parasitica CBS 223.65]|eukprot:XP_012202605.1 hypothetical protein SPRG_20519 [Saprolegnia parasitica CBS 223.65]
MSSKALSAVARSRPLAIRAAVRGGHHHAPPPPPFARLPVPHGNKPLELHRDLVWTDSVAPELLLDFDSPHITSGQALRALLGMLSMVPIFLGVLYVANPDGMRKASKRGNHLQDLRWEFGQIDEPEGEMEEM